MNTNKIAHHPGVEADVSVRLVLVPLSRVNLDHVKLVVLPFQWKIHFMPAQRHHSTHHQHGLALPILTFVTRAT